MIARFRLMLPYHLSLKSEEKLEPFVFDNYRGIKSILYPPQATSTTLFDCTRIDSSHFVVDIPRLLIPIEPPLCNEIKIDGKPTHQMNLIQIDFIKDSFDRRQNNKTEQEQILTIAEELVANFINAVRSRGQAAHIRPPSRLDSLWLIQYLNDDGTELEHDPALFRMRFSGRIEFRATGLSLPIWKEVLSLMPEHIPHTWESLYLDARDPDTQPGTSVVLSYAALETMINSALDTLAIEKLDPDVWSWIKQPGENWQKEPSVSDMYDKILKLLCGQSLKEESKLWDIFVTLKKARNSFVHEGRLLVDKHELNSIEARDLVDKTSKILNWVEEKLPEEHRRKKTKVAHDLTFSKVVRIP